MNHRLWQTRFYQVALLGGLCAGALWLVLRLRVVFVPMIIGTFIAYALKPMVGWLRRHRVPGFIVLSLPLGLVIAIGVLLVGVVIPGLARELMIASRALPDQIQSALHTLDPIMLERFDFRPSAYFEGDALRTHLEQTLVGLVGPATSMVTWILSGARELVWATVNVLLTFVVAAFVIDDFDLVIERIGGMVPPRYKDTVYRVSDQIDTMLRGFIGGELLLFLLAALTFTSGLLLLKVPFAGLVGPVAATIYLIPYLGFILGTFMALGFSLLQAPSIATSAAVVTLFGTFYIIDLLFITPRIVGGRAGVAPLTVLLGIIAGGELFGLLGILLAIPGLAVAQILIVEMTAIYKRSSFYLGSVPEASSAPSNDDTESL